jgi:class 3 adenylate cyclase
VVSIGHAFSGRSVKTTDDGVPLQFPSIVAAVECAALMQKMIAERNAALPEDKRILYRIGVNLDDVKLETWRKEVGLTCQVSRPRELDTSWQGSWR